MGIPNLSYLPRIKVIPQIGPINWFILFFICLNKIYYLSSIKINKESARFKSYSGYNFCI